MLTSFRPVLRSRHPSHRLLSRKDERKVLPLFPFKSVIRLGSTTDIKDTVTNGGKRIEINTVESVRNSSNKLRMKTKFTENNVKTAQWFRAMNNNINEIDEIYFDEKEGKLLHKMDAQLPFPLVAKAHFGSRGQGNTKINSNEELLQWVVGKNLDNYIFEKYYSYNREYRLHINEDGCFYTCRKVLKGDAPEEVRWYRNDAHCNWIMEENELFDKPVNWNEVVAQSVAALKAVGLDVGAVDLRIQSAKDKKGNLRENPEFIVVEINSAPSFGEKTEEKYLEVLPKMLNKKYQQLQK